MPAIDVQGWDVAVSLTLVAVAVALSAWRRLGLEAGIAWAAVRAIAQLLVVGGVLSTIIGPDQPLAWSWLWVALMAVVADDVVRRRAPEVPGVFGLAAGAFAASAAITMGVLFGLGVFPLEGRTVVPLAGLMVGNTMQPRSSRPGASSRRSGTSGRRSRRAWPSGTAATRPPSLTCARRCARPSFPRSSRPARWG